MIIVTSEYVFNNPKLNEINDISNNTVQEHKKEYGNKSVQKNLIMNSNVQSFDKIKNKTKNISTKCGV